MTLAALLHYAAISGRGCRGGEIAAGEGERRGGEAGEGGGEMGQTGGMRSYWGEKVVGEPDRMSERGWRGSRKINMRLLGSLPVSSRPAVI